MATILRRLRSQLGALGMLAVLVFAATLLVVATPRLANHHIDQGLRDRVEALPPRTRDLSYTLAERVEGLPGRFRPTVAPVALQDLRVQLPLPVRDRANGAWYSTQVGPSAVSATGADLPDMARPPQISLREQSGAQDAVRMVTGVWPRNEAVGGGPVAVAVAAPVAAAFRLRVGSRLAVHGEYPRPTSTVDVVVSGIFEPIDPTAPIWAEQPEVLQPYVPNGVDPPPPWRGILLTDTRGINTTAIALVNVDYAWRFRLDLATLDMSVLPEVTQALVAAHRQDVVPQAAAVTGLDSALSRYAIEVSSARSVLAVVQAGILAALLGLVPLAAATNIRRRRAELALLRARGSSLRQLVTRLLAESVPAVAVAVGAGYLAAGNVAGRPGGTDWVLAIFAAVAVLATPVLGVLAVRPARPRPARGRFSLRRATLELTVLVLAGVGAYLVRSRGLSGESEVDVYLTLVPVLLAVAAALVTWRLFPWPLRLFATGAARARGAVPFLGLARAARATTVTAGPLAVLVVTLSVGVFSATVAATVASARDRLTDIQVPGDAIVHGGPFVPDALAGVPGVTAVAPISMDSTDDGITVVVVDAPALAAVIAASGRSEPVPAALVGAGRSAGSVPAVASAEVGGELTSVHLGVRTYDFRVAEVVTTFPGVPVNVERFVVLPAQALADPPPAPTAFAVAGPGVDPAALRAAGDEGHRAWIRRATGATAPQIDRPTDIERWSDARAGLDRSGVDRLLSSTYLVGALGAVALALVAVGFLVVGGARARGQALSRLRTMGLSTGQGRRLLAYELVPLLTASAFVGAAVGVVLPLVLAPALGLSTFTGGLRADLVLSPVVATTPVVMVVVAVVVAILIEAVVNKRAGLGSALRVGEAP